LDESPSPRDAAEKLRVFHAAHPATPLIVSTRLADETFLEDLPRVSVREMTSEELDRVIKLRLRCADEVVS
jgi:hypothetical protein